MSGVDPEVMWKKRGSLMRHGSFESEETQVKRNAYRLPRRRRRHVAKRKPSSDDETETCVTSVLPSLKITPTFFFIVNIFIYMILLSIVQLETVLNLKSFLY